jgi:hypothetical protein
MLFFPQLGVALIACEKRPPQGQFVGPLATKSAYLVPADTPPKGAKIATGVLGGWNFADGWCVHLVYASSEESMCEYRRKENGSWLVPPRKLPDGRFCGLIITWTHLPLSIGCTPVVAEQALSKTG